MGRFRRRVGTQSGTAPGGGAPPTPAPWLPSDIAGIQGWWRADLGVTKDGSNNVSAWQNQITYPAVQEVTQATPANQPLYVASDVAFNGRPSILFSPGEGLTNPGRMPNPGPNASPSTHIAILVASGAGQISAAGNAKTGAPNFTRTLLKASIASYSVVMGSSSSSHSADLVAPFGGASLVAGELETTADRTISVNGVSGSASFSVSGSGDSDSFGLGENAGQISSVAFPAVEYLFVPRLLTAQENSNLEAYVTTRYGITFPSAGTPDIATLGDLTWEAQGDATATQAGGADTDISYNTGTNSASVRGLYATVDGSVPVEVQAQATPSGAIPDNASLGVYLEDAAGEVLRSSVFGTIADRRAYDGPGLSSPNLIASPVDAWTSSSIVRIFRGATYEEVSCKGLAADGPFLYAIGRARGTTMGVPVRGGLAANAPTSGSFSYDITKLRIGEPEVLAAIGGTYNLGSMTGRNSSAITSNPPTQHQTTGDISVPSRTTAAHSPGLYLPTDEAEGDLVLGLTVAPSGTFRISAAGVFDVSGDKQMSWGPVHNGTVSLYSWSGFGSPSLVNSIARVWAPATDRVRIQVTATQLRYDLSTDSGATWNTEFTEALGSEHATPQAMGFFGYASGVGAGVAATITEMNWTPS